MKTKIFYILLLVISSLFSGKAFTNAQLDNVVFNSSKAGEFANAYKSTTTLKSIKISGPINGNDLKTISDQYALNTLDLQKAQIEKSSVGIYNFESDELCPIIKYLPLSKIILPEGLKKIQKRTFYTMSVTLKEVYVPCTIPPECEKDTFKSYTFNNATIFVPSEAISSYKSVAPWSSFLSIREDPNYGSSHSSIEFKEKKYIAKKGEYINLIFTNELPNNATLKVEDKEMAVLEGKRLLARLVGSTRVELNVNGKKSYAEVVVEPNVKFIEPYIDWNANEKKVLDKIGKYPHKDSEAQTLGFHCIDFDFGNMGQRFVRYFFNSETKLLESVIIGFISPSQYKEREMDTFFAERYHTKIVKEGLAKIFIRGNITVETMVTPSIAMASYKPTKKLNIADNKKYKLETDAPLFSTIQLFIETSSPFAIIASDGSEINYEPGGYGFKSYKSIPIEIIGKEITIKGGNITKLGCQGAKLKGIDIPLNSELTYLNIRDNEIGAIDVSQAPSLNYLICSNNALRNLNLENNHNLIYASAALNYLTTVNLGNLKQVETVYLNHNSLLHEIDLSGCNNIVQFWADDNAVSKLIMPTSYNNLRALFLRNCRLTKKQLQDIFDKLPDVNNEEINKDNERWMRQLHLERTPNIENINITTPIRKGWKIDIKGIISGNQPTYTPKYTVYPTKAKNTIIVDGAINAPISIYSTNGELIMTSIVKSPSDAIDISTLAKGFYVVNIAEVFSTLIEKE